MKKNITTVDIGSYIESLPAKEKAYFSRHRPANSDAIRLAFDEVGAFVGVQYLAEPSGDSGEGDIALGWGVAAIGTPGKKPAGEPGGAAKNWFASRVSDASSGSPEPGLSPCGLSPAPPSDGLARVGSGSGPVSGSGPRLG